MISYIISYMSSCFDTLHKWFKILSDQPSLIIQLSCNANVKELLTEQINNSNININEPYMFKFENSIDVYTNFGKKSIDLIAFDIDNNNFKSFNLCGMWSRLFGISGVVVNNNNNDNNDAVCCIKSCINTTCENYLSDRTELVNKVFNLFEYVIKSDKKQSDKEYVIAFSVTSHYDNNFSTQLVVCSIKNNNMSYYVTKQYASLINQYVPAEHILSNTSS